MLKLIIVGIIAVGLLFLANDFKGVETYQDAVPKVKDLGGKSVNSMESTFDYGESLVKIWTEDRNK